MSLETSLIIVAGRAEVKRLFGHGWQLIIQFGIYILFTNYALAQPIGQNDYKIYSSIIRNEISDSTYSIAILKIGIRGKEVQEYTQNIASALKSGNQNSLQHVYSWTESENGGRPTPIDTMFYQYILDFCSYPSNFFELADRLQIPCRTIILDRYPIKGNTSKGDWDQFYEKYPGSGGIFSFSRVLYYEPTWTTAIVYFWHRRYDLNGHGALAILKKVNDGWNILYKTYLWWN